MSLFAFESIAEHLLVVKYFYIVNNTFNKVKAVSTITTDHFERHSPVIHIHLQTHQNLRNS